MNRFFAALVALVALAASPSHAETVKIGHDGLTLNANRVMADGKSLADGVILMTHGTLAHGGMEIMAVLQETMASRGFSSLAITLSLGLDNRSGMYDCATPHRHRHTDALDEIGAWLLWLKGQGATNVALLGHSRGGNQTAWFVAERDDPVVSTVVLVAPSTWSPEYARKGYESRYKKPLAPVLEKAKGLVAAGKGAEILDKTDFVYCESAAVSADAFVSYYEPDERMDTPTLLPRIKKPVLVVAGSADTVVKGLEERVPPLQGETLRFEVIQGADHFFRDLYAEDVADLMEAFIGK
ncbi:MAG: alpha/beta hydrolase [Rhodospirillales bacterium]|nr:alpha/beta hydrolase [Rhodospirillales bacterium]